MKPVYAWTLPLGVGLLARLVLAEVASGSESVASGRPSAILGVS